MKKTLSLILAAIMALSLFAGCDPVSKARSDISSAVSGARSDLSSALSSAKSDINSAIDGAKSDVSSALDGIVSQGKLNDESSSSSGGHQAQLVYTMDDVKALKRTNIFADNAIEHIFDGTINSKGKATGYHYDNIDGSKGSIIPGTASKPDKNGVYTAKVEVSGVKKNGFSSFYPDSWSPQQVVDAINEAYEDALSDKSNKQGDLWIGYAGDLEIDMYLDNNKKITTAYPIYEGD
jgi:hypothetical protein